MGINQYAINHSEANYAEADKFIPERFLEGHPRSAAVADRQVFQPFSHGERNCLGRKYVSPIPAPLR